MVVINVLIVVTEVMITHVMVVKLMLRLSTLRIVGDHTCGGAVDDQGCINCAILLSGIGARGGSSEHMENMEMFSCSPT